MFNNPIGYRTSIRKILCILLFSAEFVRQLRLSNNSILKIIVETNNKQRFKISEDEKRIRANQGHSINIDLEMESKKPPDILYHGTAGRFIGLIMEDGLKPMARQYVHLSTTENIALNVGKRHGKPIVLYIATKAMYEADYKFYLSENKVWLVDKVPVEYISVKTSNRVVQ